MVSDCKFMLHIAGRVHIDEGVVGEAAAVELNGEPGGPVAHSVKIDRR